MPKKHILIIIITAIVLSGITYVCFRKSVDNNDIAESFEIPIVLNPKILKNPLPAGAVTQAYELLVKKDSTGVGTGAYQAGDVVVVKPAGYNWSSGERNNFIIVKAELTEEQVKEIVKPKERYTDQNNENKQTSVELQYRRAYNFNIRDIISGQLVQTQDVIVK